jgi:hypothetical protein
MKSLKSLLQPRSWVLGDLEEHLHGVQSRVRWAHLRQFDGSDTQRPDVGAEVVARLLYNLGRHPERCTDECHALRLDVGKLGGDSEVSELDLALVREEDVGGLDVPVDLAGRVEVVESEEEFATGDGNLRLAEGAGLVLHPLAIILCLRRCCCAYQVPGRAAAQKLHDDP